MSAGAVLDNGPAGISPARAALARLARNPAFVIGGVIVFVVVLVALSADWLAPFDPLRNNVRTRLQPPSAAHWFGTDHFGRDILSRVMVGARISLAIGAMVVVATGIAGTAIGALAGYFPRLDQPLMRLMDALMAFPSIVLAMVISAVMGASVTNVVIALAIATAPHTARIVRASVLVGRELDYVEAARALGAGDMRILFRHVLVNATGPLIVRLTYVFAIAILAEAALSFVGAGPPPPAPSFGAIIAQGRDFIREAPWITLFPGLAIILSVLGLNLLGDGLRDVLDPRDEGLTMALLAVDHLSVALGASGQRILDDVSLALDPGEVLGIVGESGSGKSMLALSIMGLLPRAIGYDGGAIRLDGADLVAEGAAAWRRRRGRDLAMIFQEPMTALNPVMRVGRQVAEVLVKRRGLSEAEARREALALFGRVEIARAEAMLDAYPHEMSGGMRQRVMIAMALATRARVLIADEPTTALDVTIQAQILDLLRDLKTEYGLAVLFITHDLGVIAEIADRVMVLYAGRVAETAPVRALFDAPRHPYTRALLGAIPQTAGPRGRLVAIDGAVPATGAMPEGCRFAPRCPLAEAPCLEAAPPLAPVGAGHAVACIEPIGYRRPGPAGAAGAEAAA